MIHECIRLNLLIGVRYSLYNICECIRLNWLESVRYSSRNKWISEETHYATSVWVIFIDVKSGLVQVITGINPEAVKWGDDHYVRLLCPGLQPGPPTQTPGGLGLIRKSKDYVYGIWVYKALDIWKGYYRVKKSLVSYMKPWTEARNNKYMKYHSKITYQLSFWNVSRKVDYHAGGKWFIHGPKRRKENQLLSLKHPCWLSLV